MASTIMLILYCCLFGWFEVSDGGVVYKVGDGSGWTSVANINYADWSVNKSFQVGDLIVFEYNPLFHNVMRVTHTEYRACTASNPMSIYATGNDTIPITTHGHHFFLCGVPGHCQAGQKVDINVLAAVAPPIPSGVPATIPPSIPLGTPAKIPPSTPSGAPATLHPSTTPAHSGSGSARPRANRTPLGRVGLQVLMLFVLFRDLLNYVS